MRDRSGVTVRQYLCWKAGTRSKRRQEYRIRKRSGKLRAWFGEKSDCYEALVQKSGGMLEHAFDFMEAALGTARKW